MLRAGTSGSRRVAQAARLDRDVFAGQAQRQHLVPHGSETRRRRARTIVCRCSAQQFRIQQGIPVGVAFRSPTPGTHRPGVLEHARPRTSFCRPFSRYWAPFWPASTTLRGFQVITYFSGFAGSRANAAAEDQNADHTAFALDAVDHLHALMVDARRSRIP